MALVTISRLLSFKTGIQMKLHVTYSIPTVHCLDNGHRLIIFDRRSNHFSNCYVVEPG